MITDHLPVLFPGVFAIIPCCYEALGFFSMAEGFVFLSGYVTGLVYTRVRREKGDGALYRKAIHRSFTIYAYYVSAVVVLLVTVRAGGRAHVVWGSWQHLMDLPLRVAAIKVAALVYQPTFLEILPMYAGFLLLAPVLITLLDKGMIVPIAATSVLLWGLGQFGAREDALGALFPTGDVYFGVFNLVTWQLLFVSGLICGHRSAVLGRPWIPQGWKLPLAAYLLALGLFALKHHLVPATVDDRWIQRSSLGPLRLLDFACLVYLVTRFRGNIERRIAWEPLALLSRNSLQIFAFHLMPIYLGWLVIDGKTTISQWIEIGFFAFCVLGLMLIARLSEAIRTWFRMRNRATLLALPQA
jgi:hypothetical protein